MLGTDRRGDGPRPAGSRCVAAELPEPEPGPGQVLIRVSTPAACAAPTSTSSTASWRSRSCRWSSGTRSSEGRRARGARAPAASQLGERVGVPWLGWTDGDCRYCRAGRENLCEQRALHRLRHRRRLRRARSCGRALLLPDPGALLRRRGGAAALRRADRLPGAAAVRRGASGSASTASASSAHIVCQVAAHQGRRVFAFTREGDSEARRSPASWGPSGRAPSGEPPPEQLDAAIVFAPVGELMVEALRASAQGRRRSSAPGIHMSDIPSFPYDDAVGRARRSARSPT